MKCIIGLGNPGRKYSKTRHNVGFMIIDEIAERFSVKLNEKKFNGLYTSFSVGTEKLMLLQPETYMNLSGEAVRPIIDYYKIPLENIVVIYDDLDLPVGKIRLREKGGHGGHNGIRSLIQHLGTNEFKRVRVGIGRPENTEPIVDYVLRPFAKVEKQTIDEVIQTVANACEMWLEKPYIEVMNAYNK